MSGTTNTAAKIEEVQAQVRAVRDEMAEEAAQRVRDAVEQQENIDELAKKADGLREAGKVFSPKPAAPAQAADVDGQSKASRGRRALDAIKGVFAAIGNGFVRFGKFLGRGFTAIGEWFKNLRKPKAETAPAAVVLAVATAQPEAPVASSTRAKLGDWFRNLRKPKAETTPAAVVSTQPQPEAPVPSSPRAFQGLGGTSPKTSPRRSPTADVQAEVVATAQPVVTAAPVVEQQQQPAADVAAPVVSPRRSSM